MSGSRLMDDAARIRHLIDAQTKAVALFDAVVARGILAPGVSEREASDAVRDLGAELFGADRHWHKRIVRAGRNTLEPYNRNPPDRVIGSDDIVFCDFGPVFEQWEADFGRTYVLGDDPAKHALVAALPVVWRAGWEYFHATPDVTGEQLYDFVCAEAARAGWEFGGSIAGHLVGRFPHEKIDGDAGESYIAPGNAHVLRREDKTGAPCHWILEVHLVDRARGIGGFVEELLDIGTPGL
jgi:Xaa-Pro aminopeptidase